MRLRKKPALIYAFEDERGFWRWRASSANGQKIATSGESFSSKTAAERAIDTVLEVRLLRGNPRPHPDPQPLEGN